MSSPLGGNPGNGTGGTGAPKEVPGPPYSVPGKDAQNSALIKDPGSDARRLIRAALLMLVLLATGVGAVSWERLREASSQFAALPFVLFAVICGFAALVYFKTREITELRSAVSDLNAQQHVLTSEMEATKLLQTVTASREAFRDLIDSFDEAVFTLSLDGKIRAVNKAFTAAVQRPFQEVVGHSLGEFITEPKPETLEAALPYFIEKRQWSGLVRAYVAARQQWRYFECTLHPVVQDDSVLAVTVIADDVTAERERETLYTALFDSLTEPVWVATTQGRLIEVNRAFVEMVGAQNKEAVVGQNILDMVLEPQSSALSGLLRSRQPVRDLELTVARGDGSPAVCLANATPVMEVSGATRYNGTFTDVTQRRAMERKLERERKLREQLVASFPDPIVTLDAAGRFTFLSGRAERLFGESAAVLAGTHIAERFDEMEGAAMRALLLDCLALPDTICSHELHLKSAQDGKWLTIQVQATTLRDDEQKVVGVVASLRDMSQQRRIEEELIAKERLAAVGQMIDGFAHELNNPLTAILGACDLLATDDRLPTELERNFQLMQSQTLRAREIVQNLMMFAQRPADGRSVVIEMQDLIDRTVSLRRHSLRAKGITVDFVRGTEAVAAVGDPSQLMQVFLNLLVNAEDATVASGRGGGVVRITAGMQSDRVWCAFEDEGPGMAPEVVERLFEPFYSTRTARKGAGLGLSICRAILQAHSGRIEYFPSSSGGSVFRVSLPRAGNVNQKEPGRADAAGTT
jgi:PAS domain S-box-containing protein